MDSTETNEFFGTFVHIMTHYDQGPMISILELFKAMTEVGITKKFQVVDSIFYKVI